MTVRTSPPKVLRIRLMLAAVTRLCHGAVRTVASAGGFPLFPVPDEAGYDGGDYSYQQNCHDNCSEIF